MLTALHVPPPPENWALIGIEGTTGYPLLLPDVCERKADPKPLLRPTGLELPETVLLPQCQDDPWDEWWLPLALPISEAASSPPLANSICSELELPVESWLPSRGHPTEPKSPPFIQWLPALRHLAEAAAAGAFSRS